MIEATTSSPFEGLGTSGSDQSATNSADDLGMSTFLQLMTTQLRNQDPSAPQDSSEFLSQLAQFSSLTGLQSIDRSIAGAVEGLKSDRLLQASAMVGKQVVTRSDQLSTQEPPSAVSGQIDLPAATAGLTLSVQSASGQTLRSLPLGSQAAGIHEFTWDGLDLNGNPLPAGDYRLVAVVAESSDQSPEVRLRDQVTSVTVDESGELHLNLSQMAATRLTEVLEVS